MNLKGARILTGLGWVLLFCATTWASSPTSEQAGEPCTSRGVGQDSECVINGLRIHFVDWGGPGGYLVLLAGLDDSARIYDELAPMLAKRHHVLAVTRRGFGHSDMPTNAYDPATLAADLREFLKSIGAKGADLVGHSLSGLELTRVASSYPELVHRLVYLDAATDKSPIAGIWEKDPLGSRDPPQDVRSDVRRLVKWTKQLLKSRSPAIEASLRQCYEKQQGILVSRTPVAVDQAVLASMLADHPNYGAVHAPALAIYADYSTADQVPPGTSARVHAAADAFAREVYVPWESLEAARFKRQIPCGSVLQLRHTGHYLFLERPAATAEWIDAFLSSDSPCTWAPREASPSKK